MLPMSDHSWVYHVLKNAQRFAVDADPDALDYTTQEALPPQEASALVTRADLEDGKDGSCGSQPGGNFATAP